MTRREFPTKVRVAAFERCAGLCERCAAKLTVGKFDYDHRIPDALGGEPILSNCEVLCRGCHRAPGGKTSDDVRVIAKAKRVAARHIGAKAPSRSPLPGGKRSTLKRTLDGRTIRRDEA